MTFSVVSDVICPWCYIGKRRLEEALRLIGSPPHTSVSWYPFQLNPRIPKSGVNRRDYCIQKFGSWRKCEQLFEQIADVGRLVGIPFDFSRQTTVPNTFDAHRLIWKAGQENVQDPVVECLFKAYFCDGLDIGAASQLVEVAAAAGLERAGVERMLRSDEGVAEVDREEHEFKALGISAVPVFIVGELVAVSGAQPPETLVRAYEQAQEIRGTSHTQPNAEND